MEARLHVRPLLLLLLLRGHRADPAVDAASESPPASPLVTQAVVDVTSGSAAGPVGALTLLDSNGEEISSLPHMAPLGTRCEQAVRRAVAESGKAAPRLSLFPDPMHDVSVAARAHSDDVRIVFFILASRPSAPMTVPRLIHALYDPSHLFLVHVDLKSNQSIHDELSTQSASDANVHVLRTRRLVQWGGFSMVSALLDSLASFLQRVDFDFVINLSDADLALRTHNELATFLRPFKGRVFMRIDESLSSSTCVATDERTCDEQERREELSPKSSVRRHAFSSDVLRRTPVIECGGFGFVSVNSSFNDTSARRGIGPACCVGQSGPLVHGTLPFAPPKPPVGSSVEHRGSQWSALPHAFVRHLMEDEGALQWARVFERRVLADELYLPTALMHSPFRHLLVNTDLRHELWPTGDDAQRANYWSGMPETEWGGAMPLSARSLRAAMRSSMVFAKKIVPELEPTLLPRYDAWIRRKLHGELDPHQPPILAPLLRVDPELHGFGVADDRLAMPDTRTHAAGGDGEWTGVGAAAAEKEEVPLVAALLPPRRVLRRRRVASLVFTDGSSCSCAPDCVRAPSGLADAPSEGDAAAMTEDGSVDDDPVAAAAVHTRGCCSHLADGRAALCDGREAAGGADAEDGVSGGSVDDLLGLVAASAPSRACPVARFDLASTGDGSPLLALFVNRAPHPVRILHVDAAGLEVPVLTLRAGEHAEVQARASYAWRARSQSGTLLLELERTPEPPEDGGDVTTVHVPPCEQNV